MRRIRSWLSRGTRAITGGLALVLLVMVAMIVTPIVVTGLALQAHSHIRVVLDPLDDDQDEVARLVSQMEASALRYVIGGQPEDLTAYENAARSLADVVPRTRAQAALLSPEAARRVDNVGQAIQRWEAFANSVIALRQEGRVQEAQATVASSTEASLINDFWRQHASLHDYVVASREAERNGVDRILQTGAALAVVLGVLGALAAMMTYRLARRTAQLYEEVQMERAHVAELADTERRRADELAAIIENMAEGVTVADRTGRIVRYNRVARETWQLAGPVNLYGNVDDLGRIELRYPDGRRISPEDLPIKRALRGESYSGLEVVYVLPDERRRYLLFGGSAVRDESGRVVLGVTVYRDITQIRELERQREEFISVIAHDLRGPIAVISGYAGFLSRLSREQHDGNQEHRAIAGIETGAARLDRMVADLLDASRIEARRLTLAKEEVDLPAFVKDVVEGAATITEGHPVRVEARGRVPPVEADPTRLEQIMMNLLSNAAKYSYPATEILVRIEPRPGEVEVSVTNEGPGIAPGEVPHLFRRFHRAAAAAGKTPGLGLGLYITKGLVEAHGGRVWVESEPGKETTFFFTLPTTEQMG